MLIQVITAAEAAALPAASINDLLEYACGVDIRRRGADEVQSDISIRGGSFEQVLVMINGVRVNDPQTGHHNLDLPLDLSEVERIEVLQGAGPGLSGNGAFSGAVNIVTHNPGGNKINLAVNGGMFGLWGANVSSVFSLPKVSGFFSASYKTCDGYTKNTDFKIGKAFYSGNFTVGQGSISLQYGFSEKAFGANSFYSVKFPDQYEQTITEFASVRYDYFKKISVSPVIYWRRHHDRFDLFRSEPPQWYKNPNFHLTDVTGGSLEIKLPERKGYTRLYACFDNEAIKSNVLGTPMNKTLNDPFDKQGFFTHGASRFNVNISAGQVFNFHSFNLSFSLLGIYSSEFGADLCPAADLSVGFARFFSWFFSAGRAIRQPTFTDLYYSGPVNRGNPNLSPEISYNAGSGFRFQKNRFNASITAFYRMGNNIIDWVKQPDSSVWESANITKLNTWGGEMSASFDLSAFKRGRFPVQQIKISYSYCNASKESGSYISAYALDYLKHKVLINFTGRIYKNAGFGMVISGNYRNGTFTDAISGNESGYRPYITCDATLFWRPLNFNVFIDFKNLFNIRYYDFGNIPMPGIWISGGIKYTVNLKK